MSPRQGPTSPPAPLRGAAVRLHRACLRLLRAVRASDIDLGLGPAQLSALSVLVFRGALTLAELAAAEAVRPPTMTRIVKGLVAKRLARRAPHPSDARSSLVSATPRGVKLLRRGQRARVAELLARLRRLGPEELRLLERATPLLEELAAADGQPRRARSGASARRR